MLFVKNRRKMVKNTQILDYFSIKNRPFLIKVCLKTDPLHHVVGLSCLYSMIWINFRHEKHKFLSIFDLLFHFFIKILKNISKTFFEKSSKTEKTEKYFEEKCLKM